MSTPTTYYAQQSDIEAYIEGWVTDNADALQRLIQRCERDVDTLLISNGAPYLETGLKYAPSTDLTVTQAAALTRAVCAQVEYRFNQGEAFFVEGQYDSWQGPDFGAKGTLPYFGPKVMVELSRAGLSRSSGLSSPSTTYLGSRQNDLGFLDHIRAVN